MTLDELKAKLPEKMQPWVDTYGQVFLDMSADGIKAWMERLLKGDVSGAYAEIVAALDNAALLDAWSQIEADWKTANVANAARLAMQSEALTAFLRILLAIAIAAVGL